MCVLGKWGNRVSKMVPKYRRCRKCSRKGQEKKAYYMCAEFDDPLCITICFSSFYGKYTQLNYILAIIHFFCHRNYLSIKFNILNHRINIWNFIDELFRWQKKRKLVVMKLNFLYDGEWFLGKQAWLCSRFFTNTKIIIHTRKSFNLSLAELWQI